MCASPEELAAAMAPAATAGTRNSPIDGSAAKAASASMTTPEISIGLGHLPRADKATRVTPAAKSPAYHQAGELPW